MKNRNSGFTLIELMIVVVIVSILAMVALPMYKDSVRKGRRADAKAALLENAQFMERIYTESYRYDKNSAGTTIANGSLPVPQSPKDGSTKFYNLMFAAGPAQNTYTLQAVPTGDQASDPCGTLTLTQTGVKGAGGTGSCW